MYRAALGAPANLEEKADTSVCVGALELLLPALVVALVRQNLVALANHLLRRIFSKFGCLIHGILSSKWWVSCEKLAK